MNIFILEDNPDRIRKFRQMTIGHNVVFSSNVEEAKKILDQELFDVILLDHDLDGRVFVDPSEPNTGYQLARYIADNSIPYKRIITHTLNPAGTASIAEAIPGIEIIPYLTMSYTQWLEKTDE